MSDSLDSSRIDYLLPSSALADATVLVVGLGSGGAPVCDHLTMAGVSRWILYDPDVLDPINLVKHPRLRSDLGRHKVLIQQDWILDRNPSAQVVAVAEDVTDSPTFSSALDSADLVLCCVDKKATREWINNACVKKLRACVTASVFRTGIGGEVFGYWPHQTGCYRCLQLFAALTGADLSDSALGLTPDEEQRIYGLGERDFHASGLSIDIQMIALIHARMALTFLTRGIHSRYVGLRGNWIVFGNRRAKGIFSKDLDVREMTLRPQLSCGCDSRGFDDLVQTQTSSS